jgi:hypothetical protein
MSHRSQDSINFLIKALWSSRHETYAIKTTVRDLIRASKFLRDYYRALNR